MKPGQNQLGSGTTPTCFDDFQGNPFVAITDNAIQMNVNVYERDTGRLVAQEEVFTDWRRRRERVRKLVDRGEPFNHRGKQLRQQ